MQKPYIVIVGVSLFFATLFVISTIHGYNEQLNNHLRNQQIVNVFDLLADDVPYPWVKKESDPELIKMMNDTEVEIRLEKKFEGSGMTREQLGRHGWTMLHMMSATLPEKFEEDFVFKINVFLNLFGQFYPCKECSSHFLKMLDENPYDGRTREDFMQYMCKLHNIVNKRLNKEIYTCAQVHDQWGGYCGCEEELHRSIEKYRELP